MFSAADTAATVDAVVGISAKPNLPKTGAATEASMMFSMARNRDPVTGMVLLSCLPVLRVRCWRFLHAEGAGNNLLLDNEACKRAERSERRRAFDVPAYLHFCSVFTLKGSALICKKDPVLRDGVWTS